MSFGKMLRITILGFGVIFLAVGVMLLLRLTHTASSQIELPAPAESAAGAEEFLTNVDRITVTEENVQDVVRTLMRPSSYSRDIVVESFWDGGSNVDNFNVLVRDGVTAIQTFFSGTMKNIVITNEHTYIWYAGDSVPFTRKNSDAATDDEYQKMITYEDVLMLSKSQILSAAFINDANGPGIFIKYTSGALGFITEVIISIELGLITSAEQYDEDTLIYRMSSGACNLEIPGEARFILPDGVNTLE